MMPVDNLSGSYNGNAVQLKWTAPDGAPNRVFIYRVDRDKFTQITSDDLGKYANGISIPYQTEGEKGIQRVQYAVALGNMYDQHDPNEMRSNPKCMVSIAIGKATAKYKIKEKELDGFIKHSITVTADADILSGSLVYAFMYDDKRFVIPFPDLKQGKNLPCVFYTPIRKKKETPGGSKYGIIVEAAPEAQNNITAIPKKWGFF